MYNQPYEPCYNAMYNQHYDTYDTFDPQYYPPRRKRRRHRRRNRQRPYWDQIEAEYQPAPTQTHVSQPSREPVICYRCGQPGHYAFACRVRLDHTRKACNFQQMNTEAKIYQQRQSSGDTEGLLGSPNEVTVVINGFQASALLDTGSTVSTVSQSFHRQYLADSPIQTLNQILNIECADGQNMPYLGYISADLQLPGTSTSANPQQCLLLVVPDSNYNQVVPLLLGTNVLTAAMTDVKQRYGPRFLQTADLHTPWYITFRCLLLRDRELQKRCNRLAIVKSAEGKTIRIPPNKDVVLQGYMDHELPYHPVCGLLQSTDRAAMTAITVH